MDTKTIFKEASRLSPEDRVLLIDLLSTTLGRPDPDIEKIWMEEVEKRVEALKSGKLKTIPLNRINI